METEAVTLGTVALSVIVVVVTERAGAGRRTTPDRLTNPDMLPKTLAGDRVF